MKENNTVVLIVDDSDINRRFTRQAIQEKFGENTEILDTNSNQAAREILSSRNDIDVVMLDYTMHGGNGDELLKENVIRSTQMPACVIAATSTHPPHNDLLISLGADIYTPKSIASGEDGPAYDKLVTLVRKKQTAS